MKYELRGLFPSPVYLTKRDTNLDSTEIKDIEDIIKEGFGNYGNKQYSDNTYIFNNKLKKLKQFCEQQIKIYVEQVISPKEELDFYITQSWLNITKPGSQFHEHCHPNSIISGVFYISTEEGDSITFVDPNVKVKARIKFEPEKYNMWNSETWFIPSTTNELILFPSWLDHMIEVNEKSTKDRISLAFNIFARGTFGERKSLTELIL